MLCSQNFYSVRPVPHKLEKSNRNRDFLLNVEIIVWLKPYIVTALVLCHLFSVLCTMSCTLCVHCVYRAYDLYSFHVIPVMGQVVAGDWKSYQYLVESIRQFPCQVSSSSVLLMTLTGAHHCLFV